MKSRIDHMVQILPQEGPWAENWRKRDCIDRIWIGDDKFKNDNNRKKERQVPKKEFGTCGEGKKRTL